MTVLTLVSANGEYGVAAPSITLQDSIVTGNSATGPCESCPGACPDLRSWHKSRLRDSICGLSLNTKRSY
jgi:hypothetical protein